MMGDSVQETVNILLVDDEARNIDALEAILDDSSYRLLRAEDADTALRTLLEHDVAAIILDIKMPGVSGFELAQLIKGTKKFRQIPILFLTAYLIDDADVAMGYGAGAVDYLTKPLKPQILRHKVAVFADLFRKTRALAELNENLETRVQERTAELERMRLEAEEANRLKDEFLATMSHELRTPLNAILGWAALLQTNASEEEMHRGLATIERNAKSQARLIDDILDVSRIIGGKLRLEMRAVDVRVIVESALDVVRPTAEAKGVDLRLDIANDTSGIVGDPDRLQQVFWNILINAIKFTPTRGTATLRIERAENALRFVVTDTGAGIPPQHLPYIFDRFRQADSSTTRKHGGLGLGLAITRHIVELHGGSISAESPGPGLGTTITVTLPIRAVYDTRSEAEAIDDAETDSAPSAEIAAASGESGTSAGVLKGLEILVVDDDEDSREMVKHVLERVGASVSTVDSAQAAVAFIRQHPLDLLISDIGMPDEDGFALMKRVRALPENEGAKLPAIALTAYARKEDAQQAIHVGYQRHLRKPVNVEALVGVIQSLTKEMPREHRTASGQHPA